MGATFVAAKMQAAGNDFIVLDNMRRKIGSLARLARRLCHRQYGIGADGVILLEPSQNGRAAYRMRIINSDGSEAEMCGNGSRCAVKFAVEKGIAPRAHVLETLAGPIAGKYISPGIVQVSLTEPSDFRRRVDVPLARRKAVRGSFINTGVPHFVAFVPKIDAVDVIGLGRQIRRHRAFAPRGTNVNFVQVLRGGSRPKIHVRTYERGVESETLACGTGATASAILSCLVRNLRPPIQVSTSGGAVLKINFRPIHHSTLVADVTMTGPVEKVFEARMDS